MRSQGLVASELGDRGRPSLERLKITVNNKPTKDENILHSFYLTGPRNGLSLTTVKVLSES